MKKVFITAAIDYVNAAPHLGHAFEKIQADVLARRHRSLGDSVFFMSGTDENSLKNVRSAEKEGLEIEELVYRNYQKFFGLKEALNLSYDDYLRTTEARHAIGVQKLWAACSKDIYKKKYSGLYCVGCEEFYKEDELVNGCCPEHGTKPELVEEDNYFFRLSKYQDEIFEVIQKDKLKIVPESRKNEILNFIKSGLQDFCISRSNERAKGWGIDVPGDSTQKVWVWFDALSSYINSLGYGSDNEEKFNEFWQEGEYKVHVIGKGITRFHAIYWPAMLLSAGISLPQTIFSHGYLTVGGGKMSKSVGNVIDPYDLVSKYGTEGVRYFLLREIPSLGDGDFTYEKFEKRYNSDLASGLGNLFSRTIAMVIKAGMDKGLKIEPNKFTLKEVEDVRKKYDDNFIKFNETLENIWTLVSSCDKYIDQEKPWEIEDEGRRKEIFSNLLYCLSAIAEMIYPFLPGTSQSMKDQLGEDDSVFNIEKREALFPRI